MMFRLRFALRLWTRGGLPIWRALAYPIDRTTFPDMGPVEMADEEIACVRETA